MKTEFTEEDIDDFVRDTMIPPPMDKRDIIYELLSRPDLMEVIQEAARDATLLRTTVKNILENWDAVQEMKRTGGRNWHYRG